MAFFIMVAGAIGGWFVGAVPLEGLSPHNLNWWQRLLVGAVAGAVMVFYVAKTDRRRFWHCLFFSFLCGMIGQPLLINTLKSLLPGAGPSVTTTADALQQSSDAVAVAVGQQSADQTNASLQQVEDSAQKLIGAAKVAQNPDDKSKATEALTSAVSKLGDSLPQAPEEARAQMIKTLTNLTTKAYTNLGESAAVKAFEAIRPLADHESENPEIRAAAESAKTQLARMLGIEPEVAIHAETGANPEVLGKLKQILTTAGYKVPSVDFAGAAHGKEAKLIYYTSGDEVDAENVVQILHQYLGSISAVLSTSETKTRPRQYQLQIGREASAGAPGFR